ncbi:glycosyltransferase family 2 protein [Blastococcus sp. SYSU D00813]
MADGRAGERWTSSGTGVQDAPAPADPPVPAVSVCIPLYRKEEFIGATIQSVLDQTFGDFELVVLDNASPDRSAEIARSFDDPRIRVVQNAETIPPTDNFNTVVALSRAPLVKVLCADDLLRPACLERQVGVLQADPGLALVTCRHDLVDGEGQVVSRDRTLRTRDLVGRQDRATIVRRLVRHGGIPVGSVNNVMFRRTAFEAAGGFPVDEDFFIIDVAAWVRLLEHGDYYGIPESLAGFRVHSGSNSRDLGGEAIATQRRFVASLIRDNAGVVRPRDRFFSALRAPVTRVRHHMLFAAAGPTASPLSRAAGRLLKLGKGAA